MTFSNIIDTSTPEGGELLSQGDNEIRDAKSGWQEFLDVDHEASLTGTEINSTDSGTHKKCTFIEQSVDPIPPTGVTEDYGILYTKDDSDSSQAELNYIDENENVTQITKGNSILLDSIFLSNDTYLDAVNEADDNTVDMIKVDTSDQVVIGHTATEPAKLATTDPPLEDADIANKKYVDDEVAASAPFGSLTTDDSESNALLKSHSYQVQQDGMAHAYVVDVVLATLMKGYVSTSAGPAGSESNVIQQMQNNSSQGNNGDICISFTVAKDSYFEISCSAGTPTIKWQPMQSTGTDPVDNN